MRNLSKSLQTRAAAAAESYSAALGVECRVLDRDGKGLNVASDGRPLASRGAASNAGCSFCALLRSLDPSVSVDCGDVHRYGIYQAERFGGEYIYFCSLSLLHWAVPVSAFGETQLALVGGPVLLVEPEELVAEELERRFGLSSSVLGAAKEALGGIRLVPPAQATAFAEVLKGVAAGIAAEALPDLLRSGLDSGPGQDSDSGADLDSAIPPFEFGSRNATYPIRKEKELIDCVSRGDREGARLIMNDLLGHLFFSSGKRMDDVRVRLQELAVLLSRAAIEGGASEEEVFGINMAYFEKIRTVRGFEEMAFLLAKVTRRFSDCVFDLQEVKHADVMHKALRYFNEHYAEKISLESVADWVHLSPSYFSRLFKAEMKMNFSAYLSSLRVEKGKRLLADRSIPLVEVAGRAGFDDQSYFTKVFKKTTGLSPGAYRESRGSGKKG
jgi:two-component system, response regulator YesN